MDRVVNTAQAEAWNGLEGAHWADHQDRWNAVNSGFNDPLLAGAAIGAGDRVLDVGCGSGQTTRLAARRATGGHALGLDLSGPQLERARELAAAEGLTNARFEQGDAQVHPLPEGAFDAAISRMGVMFFSDPVAAFANLRSALRPGGRLAFICPADPARNEWLTVLAVLREYIPTPDLAAPGAPGMFSLADPDRILEILTAAGYERVTSTPVEVPTYWGRDVPAAVDFLFDSGPGRAILAQAEPDAARRARQGLTAALSRHLESDGVCLRGTAWLVTAVRP